MLETACRAVNQDMLDEFTARNAIALKTLVEEHGVEIRQLPEDVLRRFAELSTEVLDETGATDELSQRILDSYRGVPEERAGVPRHYGAGVSGHPNDR